MSLNAVFRVRLRGFVKMPPNTNLNGPLIEWSRGNLGANRGSCRGWTLASSRISCELSSEELTARGIGRARALDDEAAMTLIVSNQEGKKGGEKHSHPRRPILVHKSVLIQKNSRNITSVPRLSSNTNLCGHQDCGIVAGTQKEVESSPTREVGVKS